MSVITVIGKALLVAGKAVAARAIAALVTEKLMKQVLFLIMDKVADSTKTDWDNQRVAEFKKDYEALEKQ